MKACINEQYMGLSGKFHAQAVLPAAGKHQVPTGWKVGWLAWPVATRCREEYLWLLGIEPRLPGGLIYFNCNWV